MLIYIATNQINEKRYVGQTLGSLARRRGQHLRDSRKNKSSCRAFHSAIKKYGLETFKFEAFPINGNQYTLDLAEAHAIQLLNTQVPNGYNLRCGGFGGRLHPDACAKMSIARKGREISLGWRANLSRALTGRKLSLEHRSALSKARKGKTLKPRTLEHAAKIATQLRGRTHPAPSPETRAKISQALRGRELSTAHKKALQKSAKRICQ